MVLWSVGRGVFARFSLAVAVLSGCGPAAKPAAEAKLAPSAAGSVRAPARSEAPEPARRTLRTGALKPTVRERPLELELRAHTRDGKYELFELSLPPDDGSGLDALLNHRWGAERAPVVALEPPMGFAFTAPAQTVVPQLDPQAPGADQRARPNPMLPAPPNDRQVWVSRLWVRRPVSDAPVRGTFYTAADERGSGTVAPFVVKGTAKSDAKLAQRWAQAAALRFVGRNTAYDVFAQHRIGQTFLGRKPRALEASQDVQNRPYELARLMDAVSGRLSVQAALQDNEQLRIAAGKGRRTRPLSAVRGPELAHHDWAALSKALGRQGKPEPLAELTPAEFYFVRSREIAKLFDLIDEIEEWGQPVADWLDGVGQRRDTFERYQAELGLVSSGLSAALGPRVVSEAALVGSDAYIHEGTDVTLILRPKEPSLLRVALSAMLTARGASVGDGPSNRFVHEGVEVTVARSASGSVHRYQASVSGFELLSNSETAIRRVIAAALGKRPRLSDEPDFRYMLARDAATADDVLAYLGDRFIENVAGPAQRIGEARRQLALAELSTPGYAALLAGTLDARFPSSVAELLAAGWLKKTDLVHSDGARIEFSLENGARSKWGSPAELVPLIDLPPVTQVTELEAQAYDVFARSYQGTWSDRFDPIALRLRLTTDARGKRELSGDLRVLPVLRGEYREFLEMVGRASIAAPLLDQGGRVLFAIGEDAQLRRELSQVGRSFFGLGSKLQFDWLGDYAGFGVDDRNELVNAVYSMLSWKMQLPDPDLDSDSRRKRKSFSESVLIDLPVYGVIAIKSRIAAGVALAAMRTKLEQSAPGVASWGEGPKHREVSTVEVKVGRIFGEGPLTIYYALTESALVVSLNRSTLERAIDRLLDAPPTASDVKKGGAAPELSQFVAEWATSPGSALSVLTGWAFTDRMLDNAQRSRNLAEAVLLSDPARGKDVQRLRTKTRAYFGSAVSTPEGLDYELAVDGVKDPVRGTAHAPIWPELPVPGSPLERLLTRLYGVRSDLSFDAEPSVAGQDTALRSLHARLRVGLAN
jgi:hypothetical protein